MGCFAKIKPLRTSAKDSKTGCCTIVKVVAFYVFGCSGCRKARKRPPKDIRRRFAMSWKHEIELGTNVPLTPVESREPRPRLARVQNTAERAGSQGHVSRTSRTPEAVKAPSTKKTIRNMGDPPQSNAQSPILKNSTAKECEWMFLAPESASHMRAIRQRGHTWFTKDDGIGTWELVSRSHSARSAREKAVRREQESNGREKWSIRERVVLDGDYFRGTNIWEAFCMERLEPSVQDTAPVDITPDKALEDNATRVLSEKRDDIEFENVGSTRKGKSRNTSPHPSSPMPIPPMSGAPSGALATSSPSPSSSTDIFRRHSGDTTETSSTDLTIPDDASWLKRAIESPLPASPISQSPALDPSASDMTLNDYFPYLASPALELPVPKTSISDPNILKYPVVEIPMTDSLGSPLTKMEVLKNSILAYKPHLAWEQWRAQRKSTLIGAEEQLVALPEFGEKEPPNLPSPLVKSKRTGSVFRKWPPWFQAEKKPEVQQSVLTNDAEVVETVAVEEDKEVKEGKKEGENKEGENKEGENKEEEENKGLERKTSIYKLARKLTGRKPKEKGKAKEIDPRDLEISPLGGFDRPRYHRAWRDELIEVHGHVYGETGAPRERVTSIASLYSLESVVEVLSEVNGGLSGSCGNGTEEYKRKKEGLGEWTAEDWERRKKEMDFVIEEELKYVKGVMEWEREGEYERIMKAEQERREK